MPYIGPSSFGFLSNARQQDAVRYDRHTEPPRCIRNGLGGIGDANGIRVAVLFGSSRAADGGQLGEAMCLFDISEPNTTREHGSGARAANHAKRTSTKIATRVYTAAPFQFG
jgi:hypothetical protein